MHTATISTCGGNFFDSGTDTASYSANENYTLTICSDVPGMCVSVLFTSFQLENNFDFLYLYNGPSSTSPLLGTYTGTNSPGAISATSGCLTIKFVSDYTVVKNGWSAVINCVQCPVNGCPSCNGGAPPSNDACSGAQNLGALPVPSPCPSGLGQLVSFNTTNLCATAEIPYNALQGCHPVGSMAVPASDVWYSFTITAPILDIIINGMITPEVALYSGTGCNNLVPRGCAIGGGGLLNTSFSGLSPGTYFLRVSGGTMNDQCNFTLSLQNNLDCEGCVIQSALTVSPPPQNGIYLAGQSVNFCLEITDFSPTSANWLHAVIPAFGPGWDTSTFSASPPLSCSGNGTWGWYNQQITSAANGSSIGPGFFYETPAGNQGGVADTDPGNNFGDNLSGNCTWNFCFTIQTNDQADCINGENLNVFIDTYSDGESGSWTSAACIADPVNDFYASLACCIPPTVSVTNPLCNGQTGSASGTGMGASPWNFIWKNTAGTIIRQTNGVVSDQIINLTAGTYTLVTVDPTGCSSSTLFVISEPQVLTASVTVNDTKCASANGKITVSASGGTAPYTYSKDNGVTFQGAAIFMGLSAGTYFLKVKDAHGCLWNGTFTVEPSTLPVITNVVSQDILCNNGTDGSIDISASGGMAPYSYSIDSGSSFQTASLFDQLTAGMYPIVVSDQEGCTVTASVTLTQPPPVNLQILIVPSSCGLSTGSITLNVLGGTTGTISYSITNGQTFQTSNIFSSLPPGVFFIEITDGNGCFTHDTAIVNNLNAPQINNVVHTDVSCANADDGSIGITASGGTGVLQYSIDNGITYFANNTFSNLSGGQFLIAVKDQNNCVVRSIATIIEPPTVRAYCSMRNTSCGLNNGAITLHPSSGLLPLQYSIDGGVTWQFSNIFSNLPSGPIILNVMDANGCRGIHNYVVGASSAPTVSNLSITDVSCFGSSDGGVVITTIGGIPPIKYSIDAGNTFSSSNIFLSLASGNYNVVVKDNLGCNSTSTFNIAQRPAIILSIVSVDAMCGLPNGSITANVSGGTGAFTYSIDGGLSFFASSVFNNLLSGSYKVVAMDANGCVEATTIIIGDALGPRIIAQQSTPQICDGFANASISLTAVSGTGVLQYSIDSGATFQTSPVFQNIFGGNYFIYVKDANGCLDSTLEAPGIYHSPVINQTSTTDISCNGFSDGIIDVAASGGNGQLSYSIDGGSNFFSTYNFDSLSLGAYFLTVIDTNNCLARDTVTISQPTPLSFSNEIETEKCDRNDGSIIIHAAGGTPGYLYSFDRNPFANDSTFLSLDSGMYHLVVIDDHGCADSADVQVSFSPAPEIITINFADVVCYNAADGTININTTGGSGILSYSIDNGISYQTSSYFDSLDAGNFLIQVTDTNGCMTDSSVSISQPAPFLFNYQSVPANCSFSNGSITLNASGGMGSLTYAVNHSGNFLPDTIFQNLISGNYTITVRDSLGCEQDFNASVSNLNGPVIQAVNSTNELCHGDQTGTVLINVSGGVGTLQYSIDNGSNFQTGNSFSNLPAGNYNIIVLDTAGCSANNSVLISEPPAISISNQVVNAACGQSNGSTTLNVTGGTGPYQYSIDGTNFQASSVFNNLFAGGYTITVRDANNCVATHPVTINNLLAPNISTVNSTDLLCNGVPVGEIIVHASGGTGSLSYSIDNGITYQSSILFDSLLAGTYYVIVNDQNNCLASAVVVIAQPDPLVIAATLADETCSANNGNINLVAVGGTGPWVYSIDSGLVYLAQASHNGMNAGIYNLSIRDANGCKAYQQVTLVDLASPQITNYVSANVNCNNGSDGNISLATTGGSGTLFYSLNNDPPQVGMSFSNLTAGNYILTVADTNSCIDTIHVVISQPPPLLASATSVNPLCFGSADGTASVVAAGGISGYSYMWSNGNTATAISGLGEGTYYVTVTDQHACVTIDSVVLVQPNAILITHTTTNAACAGAANGTASVIVTGGTGPYAYAWSPVSSNTWYAANLGAGLYNATVTDAHGCIENHQITITDPAPVTAQFIIADVNCFGGSDGGITVVASGGSGLYSYAWDHTMQTDSALSGLPVGNYVVVVSDNSGCATQATAVISSPPQISVLGIVSNTLCYGDSNGVITLSTAGGVSPYSYNWSNGSTMSMLASLPSGNYAVDITDAHGCLRQASYHVDDPPEILIASTPVDTICIGQQAELNCLATGGAGDFSYLWNTGDTSINIFVEPAVSTLYDVQATDLNGCVSDFASSFVFVHPPLEAVVSSGDTICEGEGVDLSVEPSGGNGGPYFYSWNPEGAFTQQVTVYPTNTTTYVVSVSDHCTVNDASDATQVFVNPLPDVNFSLMNAEGCVPVTVSLLNQSNTPAGSIYEWNTGDGTGIYSQTDIIHEYTISGDYDVTLYVTTPEDCTDSLIAHETVHVYENPVADFVLNTDSVSFFNPRIAFTDQSYIAANWNWNFGDNDGTSAAQNPVYVYGDTGTFIIQLIVTTEHQCYDTTYRKVKIFGEYTIYIPNAFTPNGDGSNDFFTATAYDITDMELFIFDRWGIKILDSHSLKAAWNGRTNNTGEDCPMDVYVYKINITDNEGKPHSFVGHVSLVR
ncbi:MAG: gliding motility-associated C-terminal domain-containing protein [Bacteroidetes bacterium]|nr:gliding motility-associated C-terminal domain-containing protein [Bacteroidota bacterium]